MYEGHRCILLMYVINCIVTSVSRHCQCKIDKDNANFKNQPKNIFISIKKTGILELGEIQNQGDWRSLLRSSVFDIE